VSAADIAQAILHGFDRHYALFRYNAQQAKGCFEAGDWHAIRALAKERITFYDLRVQEALKSLARNFQVEALHDRGWQLVKRDFVTLLGNHRQPELAETFFNSISTKLLHRTYFHNDYLFVRPAVATDYLDTDPPAYRVYYPATAGLLQATRQSIIDFGFACPFLDIERDLALVVVGLEELPALKKQSSDFQLQILRTLFFRNKGAYMIGRLINDSEITPFALPVLRNRKGQLFLDTLLTGSDRIEALFNFSRAYFMVDMDVPSAYVRFLSTLMPTKPSSELYTMLGLHKQGKTLFYRDMLHHLKHSHDHFTLAPGIKGLVMLVFTLASFPYVFKMIKDKRSKDTSREYIKGRYQMVKVHDRVGRMADTWEYSDVPFPINRIAPDLLAELRNFAPSLLEDEGDNLIIKHLYIERRMTPLNLHLEKADAAEKDRAVTEYGDAIKQMVAANIFPGDMLYKNFGVTRQGRIVFYDYDEITYITDCNFRLIPQARNPEDEMASEPWYKVGPNDVFPEEFAPFLLGDPSIRDPFMASHGDLLDAHYWQAQQQKIRDGILMDVFPYPDAIRFKHFIKTIH
jgi:isocitrate dehydrogenase kinase/phosphatase